MGAGEEETPGKGDTPGFEVHDHPHVAKDDRGFTSFEPARNSKRMVSTSTHCLVSWRGNCKVDIILYESDPKNPDPSDVANVTDYVVSYSCKGNTTLVEEKKQIRDLIRRLVQFAGLNLQIAFFKCKSCMQLLIMFLIFW